MIDNGEGPLRIRASAGGKGSRLESLPTRAAIAAFLFLFVSVPLIGLMDPSAFPGMSSALAKSKKGNNGNGNGGGNGNGAGKASGTDTGGGKKDKDDGGDQGGGGEFHDEGFVGGGASLLGGSDRHGRGNGKLDGNDSDSDDRASKAHWREDLGLDKQFDLGNLGKGIDSDPASLSKLLDTGVAGKGQREDREEALGGDTGKAEHESGGKAGTLDKADKQELDTQTLRVEKHDSKVQKQEEKEARQELKQNEKDARKAAKEQEKDEKRELKLLLKAEGQGQPDQEEQEALALDGGAQATSSESLSGSVEIPAVTLGSYVTQEVLALDLSAAGRARAIELGFEISDSTLTQADGPLVTLTTPAGMDAVQALALLRRELPAEYFHLNRLYHAYLPPKKGDTAKAEPTDPASSGSGKKCPDDKCFSKAAIQWKDNFANCTRDVRVGVIDTDIDLAHPTFAGQKISHKRFLSDGKRPSPNWHGTGILALLAGRPDSGTPGLIPEAKFFAASIFFAGDDGEAVTDTVSFLQALEWMRESGARLINMSFSGPQDDLVRTRINAMRAQGFVFTAAAGNEGPAAVPTYPAAYPEVIAVTAVTKDLRIYPSAGRGAHIDLAAPGVAIWTAAPNAREGYRTGTSFATPFATAVLALQRADVLYAPKNELLARVKTVTLGKEGRNPIYGRGLLQAPSNCPSAAESVSYWAPLSDTSPLPR